MLISVVVPVHNAATTLRSCLDAVATSKNCHWECVVVDDCSTDASPDIAAQYPVCSIRLADGPFGPAYARNRGAEFATGEILLFVDADVALRPDTLASAAATLAGAPSVCAVFGSYDEAPDAQDFLSQYKNLFHRFVHQQSRSEASTFWSGCGAVRRDVFLAQAGFDEARYRRPSIEDIELGMRLRAAGYHIRLDHKMQAKHLKRWTLSGLLRADIRDRALPWTQLIYERHDLPNDLNLSFSQRVSAVALEVSLLYFVMLAPFAVTGLQLALIALFLLTVGYWDWSGRGTAFGPLPPVSRIAVPILFLANAILLWQTSALLLLLPLATMLACMVLGQWRVKRDGRKARALFAIATLALGLAAALSLLTLPLRTILPPAVLMTAVVLMNQKLYRFFLRERGFVFALAVIPLHFLYYTYGVIAFVAGSAWHLLVARQTDRASTPAGPLQPRMP